MFFVLPGGEEVEEVDVVGSVVSEVACGLAVVLCRVPVFVVRRLCAFDVAVDRSFRDQRLPRWDRRL